MKRFSCLSLLHNSRKVSSKEAENYSGTLHPPQIKSLLKSVFHLCLHKPAIWGGKYCMLSVQKHQYMAWGVGGRDTIKWRWP